MTEKLQGDVATFAEQIDSLQKVRYLVVCSVLQEN